MRLPAGTRLGPYEVLEAIGAGGMGEVYRAHDSRLDRQVAIKVLPADSMGDAAAEARFEREARAIGSLNHPNVCALYDVGRHDGHSFLVMELLEGETLRDRLARGPLSIDDVIDTGVALADALDTAHARGVMHRDLKPANIFITSRGQPKILDFGLAKAALPAEAATRPADDRLTGSGTTLGTVGYMSPEQLRGEPIDARTDLFSLGLVLYEMATARPAFAGATAAVVAAEILGRPPVPPSQLRPNLPAALEATILKALEKDRDVRSQSAAELRADLKRMKRAPGADGSALSTSSASSDREMLLAVVTRHRIASAVALLVLIVALATIAWMVFRSYRSADALAIDIVPLTLTGDASLGALSPDGKFLAYLKADGPASAVWVRVLSTGGGRQIAPPVPGRRYLAISVTPDGSYVDVVAQDDPRIRYWNMWRIPFLGDAPPSRIATNVLSAVGWSPDGRHMAFMFAPDSTARVLVVANADGSNQHVLSPGRVRGIYRHAYVAGGCTCRPSWSRDGKRLLVLGSTPLADGSGDQYEVILVDATSGSELRAIPITEQPIDSAWIDDSHALLNLRRGSSTGGNQVSLFNLDTGGLTPITPDLIAFDGVSLAANRSAAVSMRREPRSGIWIGDGQGQGMSEVVPEGPGAAAYPEIDDHGTLVYSARSANGSAIYVLRPGEHTPHLVVDNAYRPHITSDGRVMVFAGDRDPGGLTRMNMDGTGRTKLTQGNTFATIAPDNQTLFFIEKRPPVGQHVWSMPLSGGEPRDISRRPAPFNSLFVSSDGRRLMFLGALVEGKSPAVLCDLPDCTNQRDLDLPGVHLTPDGQAVAYIDPADPSRIRIQPMAGDPSRPLVNLPGGSVATFAWSRNGRFLAVAVSNPTTDIVLLRGFAK